jgi:hypothetical protein
MLLAKAMGMYLMNGYSIFKELPIHHALAEDGERDKKSPSLFKGKK